MNPTHDTPANDGVNYSQVAGPIKWFTWAIADGLHTQRFAKYDQFVTGADYDTLAARLREVERERDVRLEEVRQLYVKDTCALTARALAAEDQVGKLQKLIRKWRRDDCRMGAGGASCYHEGLRQAACEQAKRMVKEAESILAALAPTPTGGMKDA